jgi:hypothetical protein
MLLAGVDTRHCYNTGKCGGAFVKTLILKVSQKINWRVLALLNKTETSIKGQLSVRKYFQLWLWCIWAHTFWFNNQEFLPTKPSIRWKKYFWNN